jgi:large subunit ribosomal protein L15
MTPHRAEIYLSDINKLDATTVDFAVLVQNGLVRFNTTDVKIIGRGEMNRAITVRGLSVTAGARKAIEAAKGTVEA